MKYKNKIYEMQSALETTNHNTTSVNKRPLVWKRVSYSLFISDITAMGLSLSLALMSAQTLKDFIAPDTYNKPLLEYTYIHDLFFIWMCPLVLFTFFVKGHYNQRVPWWSQVQSVLYICFIAFIIDGFTRFAFKMSISRSLIAMSWVYIFLLTIIGRQIVYTIAQKLNLWRIPTIIIGDASTVKDLLFAFSTDRYPGYDVKTILLRDRDTQEFDRDAVPPRYKNINIVRKDADFEGYITKYIDHAFIVSLETFRGKERDNIIQLLTKSNALHAIVPPVSRVSLFEMEPRYFFGYDIMLLHAKKPLATFGGRTAKRTIDITLSSIALLIFSPLFLIIPLFLKIEGQSGSTLYGGYRLGRNGKHFKCWKFRSMEPDSDHLLHALFEKDPQAKKEWETYRKLKHNDPRITTKTAKFIRQFSLDELPQLWNVFIGDMSIVGPRPILDEEKELFGDSIQLYKYVRPGITGLWQVSGRNDTSFQRRVYWDDWYVRNWSIWGDIVIMIKTLSVIIKREGAF